MERIKFDKRIDKDLVDVYTVFNRFSSDLIGTTVYASNSIEDFQDLDRCKKGIVDHINSPHGFAVTLENADTLYFFDFVVPAFSVKVEENVFRPYTLEEFTDIFTVGQPIKFRKKGEVGNERYLILNGYSNCKLFGETTTDIYIGRGAYTLDELFNKYEWQASDTEDFQPFGVAA